MRRKDNNEEILGKIKKLIDPDTLILRKDWEQKLKTDESRVAFLPVRPDWNEPKKLWGYYNPLTGLFYPTDALKVLLNAYRDYFRNEEKSGKYFIILDEMNLARVEYYMSDLLSLMENMCSISGNEIKIGEFAMIHPLSRCVLSKLPEKNEWEKNKKKWGRYAGEKDGELRWKIEGEKYCIEDCNRCPYQALKDGNKSQRRANNREMEEFIEAFQPIPPRIAYPENLVIIGTVNVDETTFSFAPKVLDRAFIIEFNEVNVDKYCEEYEIKNDDFKKFVKELHKILSPANLHFGYRVINEMWKYLEERREGNKPSADSLDYLICSKVLPKIHGSGELIEKLLKRLFYYCWKKEVVEERSIDDELEKLLKESGAKDWSKFKFKMAAEKIQEIWKRYKSTGYVSFF